MLLPDEILREIGDVVVQGQFLEQGLAVMTMILEGATSDREATLYSLSATRKIRAARSAAMTSGCDLGTYLERVTDLIEQRNRVVHAIRWYSVDEASFLVDIARHPRGPVPMEASELRALAQSLREAAREWMGYVPADSLRTAMGSAE